MLRIVVNVLLLVGISLGVKAQEKGVAYELKLDSVSVLGPAQVLHDKQAVPLRISGGEWGSGEPSAGV